MPLYKFKVVDQSGAFSEVALDESSKDDALSRLRGRKLVPVSFIGEGGNTGKGALFTRAPFSLEDFTESLSMLLDAGISLDKSLAIIEETMEKEEARLFVADMRQGLHEGKKFSELIHDRSSFFPKIYKNLVEVGEESGALPMVLQRLQEYLQQKKEMRSYLLSASIYPLIISLISFSVVIFMLAYIVPQFAQTFAKANKKPSGLAAMLFDFSFFIKDNGTILLVLFVSLVGLLIYFFKGKRYKYQRDKLLLSLPLLKRLVIISDLSSYFRTLGILVGNGVHLLKSVQVSERVINNELIAKELAEVPGKLRRGSPLSTTLDEIAYIPLQVTKMLAVGEETGRLDEMMKRISERYEKELKQVIKNILSAFEPLVIIFLGVIIGGIVIVMFLAISDLTTLT
ncbi:type II secretion system F family protein [Lentisphaera profundi]|uniref:Type II secretion system F family protein n=1 Tax=Lentisphaera profundi TaxID=1658616 RepID=A0ABY7VU30_9BACT|nr:type II secretion system F family protein [Lentisphaera profundi]WDE97680.1 type II secretion system F family protein [Lentisphaera profundi]